MSSDLENVLSNLPDNIFIISTKHEILFANESAFKNFSKDIVGKKCYNVLIDRKKPCEICSISELSRKGKILCERFLIPKRFRDCKRKCRPIAQFTFNIYLTFMQIY